MTKLESQPTAAAAARLSDLENRRVQALTDRSPIPPVASGGYRDPAVKASIVSETHGKCAYCESKVTHVYWGDVEHILPKSKYPDRLLDYENLTLACAVCNVAKDDFDDPTEPLINPYSDDPSDWIAALGPFLWHLPGASRGEKTILVVDLNRHELVERRLERLKSVTLLADKYAALNPGPLKDAVAAELRNEAAESSEYSFIVRGLLKTIGVI